MPYIESVENLITKAIPAKCLFMVMILRHLKFPVFTNGTTAIPHAFFSILEKKKTPLLRIKDITTYSAITT